MRIVNGTALYTSDFTPPTEPLTEVTNTKLLCCQSTTSTTAAVLPDGQITVNNNSGTAGAYAPTGLTGGIVFPSGQGTSDHSNGMYLSSPSTSFADNYTIEFWFNVDTLPSEGSGAYGSVFFDGRPTSSGNADNVFGSIYGYNTTGSSNDFTMRYHANAADRITGTTNLSVGTWYHYALVRNNGTVTQYINGTADGSYSHSTAMVTNADRPYIGGWGFGSGGVPGHNNYAVDGKMSNLRMTSTAVYTANFTPPTSNLTAIPGTTFLGLQSTSSATAYTFVSSYLQANGNAAATNFNPFTDDIDAIRGQETGYCTWNPLSSKGGTVSDGNLKYSHSGTANVAATIKIPDSGKWFWEYDITRQVSGGVFGIGDGSGQHMRATDLGWWSKIYGYSPDGNKYEGTGSAAYGPTLSAGDLLGVAYNSDTRELRFYLNGVDKGVAFTTSSAFDYYPALHINNSDIVANFGQKPFKFPPPDGFQPLNLSNVQPEKVIARPDKYIGVSLWTGNGTSQTISGLKHKPDLVWSKARSFGADHELYDSVRGTMRKLYSSLTNQESTSSSGVNSFNADGFGVTGGGGVNNNTSTYVGWTWKAGGNKNTFNIDDVGYASAAAAGLTAGTIAATGSSVGTKQGFSIVSYTGTGGGTASIPHGLEQSPDFVIIKNRDGGSSGSAGGWWSIYHDGFPNNHMYGFNNTNPNDSTWNNHGQITGTTSSVVEVANGDHSSANNWWTHSNGADYIMYSWHNVPGLQKFGTYIGNGNSNGPFIELGFKPAIFWMKAASAAGNWIIIDNKRPGYNSEQNTLCPNLDSGENASGGTTNDILSNGFKVRGTTDRNTAGVTYIYCAWAEAPSMNLYGAQTNAR
tara:strand:- start:146 stop:2719 length:2574 start_codon:yes stop_codon:yes gene_type:complete